MATSVPSVSAKPPSPFLHLARNPAAKSDAPSNAPDDEEDQDEAADDDDDETSDGKKKKSKEVKKAEDKEDDEDEKKPDARAARAREKARIRAIVNSSAGLRFPAAALNVALESSMPRHVAIETLARMTAGLPSGGGGAAASLRDRMAGVQVPDVGAGDTQSPANTGTAQATAAAIIAAGKKRRGETT